MGMGFGDEIERECLRADTMLALRKSFEAAYLARVGRSPPNEALNAWLFVQLARSHAAGLVEDEHLFVPLTPSSEDGPAAWPLIKYIGRSAERAGVAVDAVEAAAHAETLDAWLRREWQEARAVLARACGATHSDSRPEAAECALRRVLATEEPGGGRRVWVEPAPLRQRSVHAVNAVALDKLTSAFADRHTAPQGGELDARLWLVRPYSPAPSALCTLLRSRLGATLVSADAATIRNAVRAAPSGGAWLAGATRS